MEDLIRILRSKNELVPRPLPKPSLADFENAERILGMKLPADFIQLQLGAGDVVFGTIEPVTLPLGTGHTYIGNVVLSARNIGVPNELIPICEDNGDFFCIKPDGSVQLWSHNGKSNEKWDSLYDWVKDVWLQS